MIWDNDTACVVKLDLGPLKPSWSWRKAAGRAAGASLTLESIQYVLALGSSDVTDIIVNTADGLAGFGLVALIRRRPRARTTTVMTRVCSVGTAPARLAVGLFVASAIRYAPRDARGVRVDRSVPAGE